MRAAVPLVIVLAACGGQTVTLAHPETPEPAPTTVHEMTWSDQSAECRNAAVALQVLGSGGPIAEPDGRASSGYLLWVGGHARALVDLGPGTMRAFGASGARVEDLRVVALSHLHVDHSADFAAFLKTASFGERTATLPVIGPGGNDRFPGVDAFIRHLLAPGGYAYLDGFLGTGQPFALSIQEIPAGSTQAPFDDGGVRVQAFGVAHGPVPALAFVLEAEGARIALMSDQRLETPSFIEAIQGVDVFVAHMAIPEGAQGPATALHAPPSRIAEVASSANVERLVLSHLMSRSLAGVEDAILQTRTLYEGPLDVADDGLCVIVRE